MMRELLFLLATLAGVLAIDLAIGGAMRRRWRSKRKPPREDLPVLFRGTAEQAENAAAWRAMNLERPVIAWWVDEDTWEFRDFVAAPMGERTKEPHE